MNDVSDIDTIKRNLESFLISSSVTFLQELICTSVLSEVNRNILMDTFLVTDSSFFYREHENISNKLQ